MGTYTGSDKRLQYLFQNGGGGGASALSDLSDVELTNLANNQVIKYNSTTQKWQNANESGGGGSMNGLKLLWSGALNTLNGTLTLSESYKHFDLLIVKWSASATVNYYQGNEVIPTAEIVENQTYQFGDSFYRSTGQFCQMAFSITNETKLTLDQIQINGAQAGITIQAVYGACVGGGFIGLGDIYSTEERQIGCWKDGRPLYQKSFVLTSSLTVSHETFTNTGFSIPNVDAIRYGEAYRVGNLGLIACDFNVTSSNTIGIRNSTLYDISFGVDSVITIQYTKSTDTAGSGIWTPSGEYAVHYSTNEQVVGTYLGETLYQKTINVGHTFPINYDVSALNIKKCINCFGTCQGYGNIPSITPYADYSVTLIYINSQIQARKGAQVTISNDIEATIQYTKTV